MLENVNEELTIRQLKNNLDIQGLLITFEDLVEHFSASKNIVFDDNIDDYLYNLSNADFKTTLGDAINIYIIFRYIWVNNDEFDENMRKLMIKCFGKGTEQADRANKHMSILMPKLVGSIEVLNEQKTVPLFRIWFPILAVCNFLHEDIKDNFIKTVDRSNSQTKISALVDSIYEFIPQMQSEYNSKNRVLGFNFQNLYGYIRFLANMIALTITCINLVTYSYENEVHVQDDSYSKANDILNIIQIVFAGSLVFLWTIFRRKRHLSLMWERFVDRNIKDTKIILLPTTEKKIDEGAFHELEKKELKTII